MPMGTLKTRRKCAKRVLFVLCVMLVPSKAYGRTCENSTFVVVRGDNAEDGGDDGNPSMNRLILPPAASPRVHYNGYKVVRAVPLTPGQLNALHKMTHEVDFDFWVQPRMIFTPVDIVVAPQAFSKLRKMLGENWIFNWVTSNDLERSFFAGNARSLGASLGERFSFDQFHRLDDVYKRLDEYRASYPAEVTITTIGKTHEGREIKMVKLTSGEASDTPKKVIFLDGGTHAREWITVSTVMYILDQLMSLTGESTIRSKFDWYIVPVVNPDGYEYTHETDRLWRKNRAPTSKDTNLFIRRSAMREHTTDETFEDSNPAGGKTRKYPENSDRTDVSIDDHNGIHGNSWTTSQNRQVTWTQRLFDWIWELFPVSDDESATEDSNSTVTPAPNTCVGVDLNRNWGHHWGEIGVEFDPCSLIYPGTKAFSELETQAMRDAFEAVHDRTLLYISYHSFGEMILLPWGYTYMVTDNFIDMMLKGLIYAGKMKTWYLVGSGTWLLYPVAGDTVDWVTHKGVPYAFTIELSPSSSQSDAGFVIPASEIVRVGQENWDGLKALAGELSRTIK